MMTRLYTIPLNFPLRFILPHVAGTETTANATEKIGLTPDNERVALDQLVHFSPPMLGPIGGKLFHDEMGKSRWCWGDSFISYFVPLDSFDEALETDRKRRGGPHNRKLAMMSWARDTAVGGCTQWARVDCNGPSLAIILSGLEVRMRWDDFSFWSQDLLQQWVERQRRMLATSLALLDSKRLT